MCRDTLLMNIVTKPSAELWTGLINIGKIMTYNCKKIIRYFIKHPVVEALSTWHSTCTSQINTPAIYLNFYECNKAKEVPK